MKRMIIAGLGCGRLGSDRPGRERVGRMRLGRERLVLRGSVVTDLGVKTRS